MNLDIYNQYRDKMLFGDVIAFSGKGTFSDLIKNVTASDYSHVGMVFWMQPIEGCPMRAFIIESTTLNNLPDITGEYRKGVQMINLAQRLEGYDGKAWWFPLKDPLNQSEKLRMASWLLERHSSRTPYDLGQGVKAAIDGERWPKGLRWLGKVVSRFTTSRENMRKLFCSELVTKALQIGNRIDPSINASEQVPADVLKFDCFGPPTKL